MSSEIDIPRENDAYLTAIWSLRSKEAVHLWTCYGNDNLVSKTKCLS